METKHSGIDHRVTDNIRFNASGLARIGAVPGMERDDIQQDLVVDLLHRSKKFNPTLASFQTFADRVVAHRISSLTSPPCD